MLRQFLSSVLTLPTGGTPRPLHRTSPRRPRRAEDEKNRSSIGWSGLKVCEIEKQLSTKADSEVSAGVAPVL
ncbi:hypothetical protein [Azospirillum sp. SYSU D00513]|uniref:hypothetical protein n=1 Tax=Azospirillum sp. SYSU D00513 TaxID=2812561 RepID=UPI001A95F0BF|nr:hypothetical protein [Azospirillum sp. SYSU D00513]